MHTETNREKDSTHTPIPWKLDSKPTDYPQTVESSDGTVLAITGNDRANAAFIVRAANNHAELLEALERALTTTQEIERVTGQRHYNPGTLQKMADAIKKAKS